MKTIYKDCNLIDGLNNPVKPNISVAVENGKITAIGSNLDETNCKVIDLNGKYLMPGMINLHVHLFGTGMPSKILGGGSLQKFVLKFITTSVGKKVLDAMLEANAKNILYSGVTTARSVGDFHYSDVRLRDNINNGKKIGPNLLVSGPAVTVPTGHGDGTFALTSSTPEGIKALVDEVASHNVDLIKICITGGVMDAKKEGEPGELKMDVELSKAAVDEAHKLGLTVASHTESEEGVKVAIEAKVDTIEHGSIISKENVEKLKEYNGAFVCTLSPALPLAKLDPSLTKLNPMCVYNSNIVFNNMVEGSKTVMECGGKVGLGTDASCPFVTQYNTYLEVAYANKFLGLSPLSAINVITMKNAEILGKSDEIGSIEVSKNADMLVLNANPTENLSNLSDVFMVVKNGEIYDNLKIKKNEKIETELKNLYETL